VKEDGEGITGMMKGRKCCGAGVDLKERRECENRMDDEKEKKRWRRAKESTRNLTKNVDM
jgi:hypothetical protein